MIPSERTSTAQSSVPLLLFGIGLGGFVDGIVLHQILQWHHMISENASTPTTTIAGLEANTLADGLFHLAALAVVVVALWLMSKAQRGGHFVAPSRSVVVGWLLVGWGSFNIVEGLIDHHLLRIHHVRDDVSSPWPWDVAFLILSACLLAAGRTLIRRSGKPKTA